MIKRIFHQKPHTFKIAGIFALAIFAFSIVLISQLNAQQLKFNVMAGDRETLRMKNDTKATTQWSDPISADAGDEIRFNVYYHCGWDDVATPTEKARNTKIRVTYPVEMRSTIQTAARVWADNVPAITDSGTINVSSLQKLTFENTAKWHHGDVVEDVVVTVGQGYVEFNLGDVSCDAVECYVYPGTVVFKARLSQILPPTVDIKANNSDGPVTINYNTAANLTWTSTNATTCQGAGDWTGTKATSGAESTGNLISSKTYSITCTGPGGTASDSVLVNVHSQTIPALNISKSGRNISQAQSNFAEIVSANPFERIEFRIEVSSTGSATAQNVRIKDILPSNMSYFGNLRVGGISFSGDILNGINIGSLTTGSSSTITFEAQIYSQEYFGYGTTSLVNTGYVWADGVSRLTDTATINVTRQAPPPSSPGLSIEKLGRNLTRNTSFSDSVLANPGEKIEFRIRISSTGTTTAHNVVLRDVLSAKMSYEGNLKIDGVSSGGNIVSGLNLGAMAPGITKVAIFEAKMALTNQFSAGTTTLVNTAYVKADGLSEIQDSATLTVTKSAPLPVSLSIDKKVRNLTKGQTSWLDSVSAAPGDKLAFKISVSSIGQGTASDIIVKDSLSEKIIWHGNLTIEAVASNLNIKDGLNIKDLTAGSSKTIIFEALLTGEDEFVFGTTNIINTAMAYNTEEAVTDTAKIIVQKRAVAGAVTEVPTGVLNSLVLSLGVTFLLTYCFLLGFYFYQKVFVGSGISLEPQVSGVKKGFSNWCDSLGIFRSPEKSEKELLRTISKIRKKESAK